MSWMAFTGDWALVPLASLTTDRYRVRLRAGDGTVVEVSDDRGHAGRRPTGRAAAFVTVRSR